MERGGKQKTGGFQVTRRGFMAKAGAAALTFSIIRLVRRRIPAEDISAECIEEGQVKEQIKF